MELFENKKKKSKKKIEEFEEPLEQPGKIFLAEIHGSAQRLLKIKKLSKYIRFCQCCLLPSETPGIVMPYTCLDNLKEFGIGIHLYFHFIRFCFVMNFISFCLSSIPTMVFSIRYSNHLSKYCRMYYNDVNSTLIPNINNRNSSYFREELVTNNSDCLKYLSSEYDSQTNEDLSTIVQNDWILKMSADNAENYFNIFKEKAGSSDRVDNVIIDYSLIYFITSITLLIINFFFIHFINILNDQDNLQETTPRDFTILVHGVKRNKKQNNLLREDQLKNLLNEISQNYFKLEIYQIIPCYNLVELYKLTKKVFEDRVKIYHIHNFKLQKDLHQKYMSKYTNNYMIPNNLNNVNNINTSFNNSHLNSQYNSQLSMIINRNSDNLGLCKMNDPKQNLNYYSKYPFYLKVTPLHDIEERIKKNQERIKEIEQDLTMNPDKYNSGSYFIVFKYISMRDKIYSFFPTNFSTRVFMDFKYFFQNIVFSCCVNERTKRTNYLKTAFIIEHATEAYEILWQNLGYSFKEKYLFLLISLFVSLILIGASLCVVILFNEIQFRLTENGTNKVTFWKYFLSLLISIVIAITNSLGRYVLKKITAKFEAIETRTGYYISLSVKITFFTFINTAIVPLLSNYIRGESGKNDILLNNLLLIFILNITLTPLIFYVSPSLCLKISRRAKARIQLEGVPVEDSTYTQKKLNKIFENPSIDLSYKYSYYTNILLTSLFYMSVFPIGTVFSFVALLLSYFIEIYYLGFYKRPELLNARLCKFFMQNFKVYVSVFCIGNYIFLSPFRKYSWTLVNLILFIVIAFIPYQSYKINFLGVTEGETTKGSYEDYYLMFPTDYEKQNPLTRKSAMMKYFKKLEEMNLIDKYQSQILINEIQKEDILTNYYKTSRNVANVLNSYEFQRQFVKSKKRYKFIKEFRRRQNKLNLEKDIDKDKDKDILDYDIDKEFDKRFRIRGFSSHIKRSRNRLNELNMLEEIGKNKINNKDNDNKDEESNLGFNKKYDVNVLIDNDKFKNKRASVYMRKALFKRIKDEGIFSDSEEESEDDSFDSESYVADTNRKKTSLEENSLYSNKEQMNFIKEEDKSEDNISSAEHRDNVNENKGANNMLINSDLVRNTDISNKKQKGILKKRIASNENITHNKVTFNLQN